MKKLMITHMDVKNFKGLASFSSDFYQDTVISGKNALGKTTVADAFFWVMFGKDSQGNTSFAVKPLGNDGKPVYGKNDMDHGPEPEVTVIMNIDGKPIKFSKKLQEHWVSTTGEAEKHRSSDQTKYLIDDVPMKKKDFDNEISKIVSEETFKMLTNPRSFVDLPWKDQRRILVEISGDITDQEAAKNAGVDDIDSITDGKSLDDRLVILKEKRKNLSKEIEINPARIDEAHRSIEEVDEKPDELESQIKSLETEQSTARARRENPDGDRNLKKQTTTNEIERLQMQYESSINKIKESYREKTAPLTEKSSKLDMQLREATSNQSTISNRVEYLKSHVSGLRDKYKKRLETRKNITDDTCPVCGSKLNEDSKNHAMQSLNQSLVQELTEIKDEASQDTKEITKLTKSLNDANSLISSMKLEKKENDDAILALSDDLANDIATAKPDPKIETLKKYLVDLDNSESTPIQGDITDGLDEQISLLKQKLATIHANERQQKRVDELTKIDENQKIELNQVESAIAKIELVIREKVSMLEERINSNFEITNFKLFDQLKNGALKETCVLTVDGVEYGDLNSAAKINSGMDIIKTLISYYGVSAPIFIDNAESVNEIEDTGSQQIALVVTKAKQMTVKEDK